MSNNTKNSQFSEKSDHVDLEDGDCVALVRKTGELKFVHNISDDSMDETQISVAGALIAISIPKWKRKLVSLLMFGEKTSDIFDHNEDNVKTIVINDENDYDLN